MEVLAKHNKIVTFTFHWYTICLHTPLKWFITHGYSNDHYACVADRPPYLARLKKHVQKVVVSPTLLSARSFVNHTRPSTLLGVRKQRMLFRRMCSKYLGMFKV
jgi:hypothetical protein